MKHTHQECFRLINQMIDIRIAHFLMGGTVYPTDVLNEKSLVSDCHHFPFGDHCSTAVWTLELVLFTYISNCISVFI
uniref:SGNH domain-containing protein n=1 Tax=Caenorhabditis tropicalis TaxID=1561998 RepID=A0A1I7UB73_9PELO